MTRAFELKERIFQELFASEIGLYEWNGFDAEFWMLILNSKVLNSLIRAPGPVHFKSSTRITRVIVQAFRSYNHIKKKSLLNLEAKKISFPSLNPMQIKYS